MSRYDRPEDTVVTVPWAAYTSATQEEVQEVFDLYAEGRTVNAIARQIGHKHKLVDRLLADPVFWDPYVDWVVVDRAMHGDRSSYETMTYFEWVTVRDTWRHRRPWDSESAYITPDQIAWEHVPTEARQTIHRYERRSLTSA